MSNSSKEVHLHTKGILPVQKLKILRDLEILDSHPDYPINDNQFQPNSLDLRLGEVAYRVRCSFLPENETVEQKIEKLEQYSFSIKDGAVLEENCVYIIPLLERLNLPKSHYSTQNGVSDNSEEVKLFSPENLSAKANPKSSTGRLDVFTRVITDYSHRFEEIAPGYQGQLYLEVVPKSFSIKVRTGQRLNQLRVRHGFEIVPDQDLLRIHASDPLLFDENIKPVSMQQIKVNKGLFMSVQLKGKKGEIIGYKAKKHNNYIDLENIGHYDVDEFWEPIYATSESTFILEPEAFYIFASKERIRVPAKLACEMMAYDTGSGELRTHYAGFFDSGFGGSVDDKGARAVLEVRSHDVPFMIEDGQTLFSMQFEPNTELPEFIYGEEIDSNYQGQGLKLGKHFKQV
ncbi:MAG: 2'-deoxycytidine 5'-triphosphate deaminase [Balneola sp.]|jgi:dCTP deaminase|nr:2'-deoxycytidine 5'-triphosphate deaminase [Balneola sp.]MBO6621697.1 2'-deoxycytidine 5'-triphosphate deaminase [Balneola sp.]MBO6651897.1 2'-deoxycytidine 5'-triphosphate deaminase [Balneola sp.]MBO6709992.1 2'-deoxycytidine 5'-triphosphate deaminase [Balneola sp.]MBO6798676.1 2'-deoxycytidine 5'-triphosphate deaminase [Balneola sp.]